MAPAWVPSTVGGFERLGDLDPQRQRLAQRHRAPLEQRAQGFALQVLLHHVVGGAFGPHVVHRGDVWVVERRRGTGFLIEAGEALGV